MRQVGYLQRFYRDTGPTEHKKRLRLALKCFSEGKHDGLEITNVFKTLI